MSSFVVDAWAWIEYFDGSKTGEKFKAYIENKSNEILTSTITLAEVISKFLRTHNDPQIALRGIRALSKIIPADENIASMAGELHAATKLRVIDFGLADAFVLATARQTNSKILTGDRHFKSFKDAILITG